MRRYLVLIPLLLFSFSLTAQDFSCPNGAPPSRLQIGERADVMGVGGSNLRELPSIGGRLINVIPLGERIPVVDGPYCAEGYAWWQVDYLGEKGWTAEGTGDFYWLAPYIIAAAQLGSVRVEALPELASGISASFQDEFFAFQLEGYPVELRYQSPILYLTQANVEVTAFRQETLTMVRERRIENEPAKTKVAFFDLAGGQGVRYVTLFFEPINSIRVCCLVYNFRAAFDDGRFASLSITIEAPNFPLELADNPTEAALQAYLSRSMADLEALPNEAFSPSLDLLDAFVQSIRVDAPLDESEVLHFTYNESLSFDYHPVLAYNFHVETIQTAPRQLRLEALGYPLDTAPATLRLYATEEIDSSWLAGLQLLLSQQAATPARIPILARDEETAFSHLQIRYFHFGSGEGIRSISRFADGEFYSYQGLSADRRFYLSVLFPIDCSQTGCNPPLVFLDDLIASLQVSENSP